MAIHSFPDSFIHPVVTGPSFEPVVTVGCGNENNLVLVRLSVAVIKR